MNKEEQLEQEVSALTNKVRLMEEAIASIDRAIAILESLTQEDKQ